MGGKSKAAAKASQEEADDSTSGAEMVAFTCRKLRLLKVDHHFAPSVEDLEITYEIENLIEDSVELRIRDCNDVVIFERPLTAAEKKDGTNTILWGKKERDKVECVGHELYGKFINPLWGPYTAILYHSGALYSPNPNDPKDTDKDHPAERGRFEVLYHSVKLDLLPWDELYKIASGQTATTDPGPGDAALQRMWAQYRLNELGYWAGPVDGKVNADFARAIRRFRHAHPTLSGWTDGPYYTHSDHSKGAEMVRDDALPQNSVGMDPHLMTALAQPAPTGVARTPLSNPAVFADAAQGSKLFIDNNRMFLSEFSEFQRDDAAEETTTKFDAEREWLSRPHLPCVATVMITTKGNSEAPQCPAAYGAPLDWSWQDFDLDTLTTARPPRHPEKTATEPSRTWSYIKKVQSNLKIKNPDYSAGKRHNAVEDVGGGVLPDDDAKTAVSAFAPCEPGAKETTNQPTGVRTVVGAPSPTMQHRGVVYFRPSTIAGDTYAIHVRLKPPGGRVELSAKTGPIVVWRRIRVVARVDWPTIDLNLPAVKAEFAHSLVDLDITDVQQWRADEVVTPIEFKRIVDKGAASVRDPSWIRRLHARVDAHGVYGNAIIPDFELFEENPMAIGQAANELLNIDNVRMVVAKDAPSDAEVASLNKLMTVVDDWSRSYLPAVQAVGAHFTVEMAKVMERAVPNVPWTMKAKAARTHPVRIADNSGGPVTARALQEMLVPDSVRTELTAYADEWQTNKNAGQPKKAIVRKPTIFAWLKTTFSRSNSLLKVAADNDESQVRAYAKNYREMAGMVGGVAPNFAFSSTFKPATPTLADPRKLLELDYYTLNQRSGEFLGTAKSFIAEVVDKLARAKLAAGSRATDGVILLDLLVAEALTIRTVRRPFQGVAFGALNGVALIDEEQVSKMYSLTAHEIAHCMFLQHGKNAPSTNTFDHDMADDNCMMSYPVPFDAGAFDADVVRGAIAENHAGALISPERHYCHADFTPHFCGKCNLKLRGWNIRGEGVLEREDSPLSVKPPPPHQPVHAVLVQFVKGSVKDDEAAGAAPASMGISMHMSNKCGDTLAGSGAALVDFPAGFGHNADAAKDPGSFRIEVVDENNTAKPSVFVNVECLRPAYLQGAPVSWAPFQGSERVSRGLVSVECQKVPGLEHTFRSRYLRLVTDEADAAALKATKQGLLVTDAADGTNGAGDKLEILDQKVRVTYDPTPAAPPSDHDTRFAKPSANAVVAEMGVGVDGLEKRRVRLFLHLAGIPPAMRRQVEKEVRRRAMRWVRRVFAPANLAPKIIGVDMVGSPAGNMLTIQSMIDPEGAKTVVPRTHGRTAADQPAKLTLNLKAPSDLAATAVEVPIEAGLTPTALGAKIRGAMPPGITAEVYSVPPSTECYGYDPSCDILFIKGAKPATIVDVTCDDRDLPAAALLVPRVNDNFSNIDGDDMFHGGSPMHRSILRLRADWTVNEEATREDRIDVFCVPRFPLEGRAYPEYRDINVVEAAKYIKGAMPGGLTPDEQKKLFITLVPVTAETVARHAPTGSLRRAIILARESGGKKPTDLADSAPFTFSHELVHVLADSGHTGSPGCILNPWFNENSVDAYKRIYTAPLLLQSPGLVSNILPDEKQVTRKEQDMRRDIRERGGAVLTEAW